MTQQQITNLVQQTLTSAGIILVILGYTTKDQWGLWSVAIMGFVGPACTIYGLIAGQWSNTQTGLVKAVDALAKDPASPVAGVIVAPTPEGKDLASSIPGTTTVTAGTVEAAKIAQNL